jgi:uncharacterized membrane protein HdeD (DUF308 family)
MAKRQEPPSTTLFTVVGIALTIFGVIAIATPLVAGTAVVMVIGVLMLIAGVLQLISGFRAQGWSDRIPSLVLGAITVIAALGVLLHPLLGLGFLTILLAAYFIVEGIWKVFASFSYRPARGWLGLLFSGVLTVVLGVLIWIQWPFSGMWAVGVLVGVNLLFTGISLIAIAATIGAIKQVVEERATDSIEAERTPEAPL